MRVAPRRYDTLGLPTRYFNPGELEALLHLYESVQPRVIVEFGVNSGRNALAAIRNLRTLQRYVGVDVPPTYVPKMQVQRREVPPIPGELARHDSRFELVLRPRGTFDLTAADLPVADVVFIDADHSREGVLNDTALARLVLRPGGMIIWHDDNGSTAVEVSATLNELCSAGARIEHVGGTWLSYQVL